MPHVTVGCKIPNGLVLRNFKMVDADEDGIRNAVTVADAQRVDAGHDRRVDRTIQLDAIRGA